MRRASFAPNSIKNFLVSMSVVWGPAGDHGTSWGDPIVADAAKLAELLYDDWANLGSVLYQIERSSQPNSSKSSPDFDIRGRPDLGPSPPGLLVHWGRARGKECRESRPPP